MRKALARAAIVIGLGLFVGCTSAEPAPSGSVEVVRGGDQPEDLTIIDLREDSRGWLFDGREAPLELDSMMLVCPNGAWMRLGSWISEQDAAFELGLGDAERGLFSLAREQAPAGQAIEDATEECTAACYSCPDGLWICLCPQLARSGSPDTVAEGSESAHDANRDRDPIDSASDYEGRAGSDGESPQSGDNPDETPSGQPDPSF